MIYSDPARFVKYGRPYDQLSHNVKGMAKKDRMGYVHFIIPDASEDARLKINEMLEAMGFDFWISIDKTALHSWLTSLMTINGEVEVIRSLPMPFGVWHLITPSGYIISEQETDYIYHK